MAEVSTVPLNTSDAEFEQVVLKSKIPVIVDFWAPWCGPCRMVAPVLEAIAREYQGKVLVVKVNTDENSQWAQKYGVRGIPTMLFVQNGKVHKTQVGVAPNIKMVIQQYIAEMLPPVQPKSTPESFSI
jgi:thioredoxin 1